MVLHENDYNRMMHQSIIVIILKCHAMLQCYTVLVLHNVAQCHAMCYTMLHSVMQCYTVLHNVTVLCNVTQCYTMLHSVIIVTSNNNWVSGQGLSASWVSGQPVHSQTQQGSLEHGVPLRCPAPPRLPHLCECSVGGSTTAGDQYWQQVLIVFQCGLAVAGRERMEW